jgi:methyl-accepting chemotaxis protein
MASEKKGRRVSLKFKIIGLGLSAIIIAILVVAVLSYTIASDSMKEQAFNQLTAIRTIKKDQIQSFFNERLGDVKVYAFNTAVQMASRRFINAFNEGGLNSEQWNQWKEAHGPKFKLYIEEYGYYDLFIISPQGDIVYTVAEESDLGKNLARGELSDSGLAKCFREGREKTTFVDFSWYDPSNEPASFVCSPVNSNEGEFIGVLAYQVSLTRINGIMQQRAGMGETGESYLVGSDKRMRSNSYLDPEGHSVKASFAGTVEENGVDTVAVREALEGKSDTKIIIDYNGNPVLSSYDRMKIQDTTWAVISEIDEAEIMEPVYFLRNVVIIVSLVSIGLAFILYFMIVNRSILRPVRLLREAAQALSGGDLRENIDYHANDEIGDLAEDFNRFVNNIHDLIANINVASENLNSAVEQIAGGNQNLSQRTSEQASSLEEVASTIEETTASVNQNAENANQARDLTDQGAKKSSEGNQVALEAVDAIKEMNESSKKIGEIISMINDIAFQTNLLALNAAVEAARAGDAGRGFAVVAGEVRNLAQRSGNAAKEIEDLIKDTVTKVDNGTQLVVKTGDELNEIAEAAGSTARLISEIAASSQEQKSGFGQINTAVTEMDNMTQQNAALVEETASASEEMANQAQELLAMVREFKIEDRVKNRVYREKEKMVNITAAGDTTGTIEHKPAGKGNNEAKKTAEKVANEKARETGPEGDNLADMMKDEGFEEF